MIIGAVLEARTGKSWEVVIKEELFKPLGMNGCGFGAQARAKANPVDQPWPHTRTAGMLRPVTPDFQGDNPPTLGPAGTVHCTLDDWGKFAQLHMDGFNGRNTSLLKSSAFKKLHQSYPGDEYTYGGWLRVDRPWAGGPTFTHSGSNTMNHAVIWMAPLKDSSFLAVTNAGGEGAEQAADEAVSMLVKELQL